MYNYPNFLNLLTTGAYIPLSFAYVIPAIRAGWIGECHEFGIKLNPRTLLAISQVRTSSPCRRKISR